MSTPAQLPHPPEPEPGDSDCTGNSDASQTETKLRLMLVTRRFWPYSGASEFYSGELANALTKAGHSVQVATIRWDRSWPTRFHFQGSEISRLRRPNSGPWGSYRYLKNLQQHILRNDPDGIIVFGLGEELTTISKTVGGQIPFVVNLNEVDLGILDDGMHLSSRQRLALQDAESIIVESSWTKDRMSAISGVTSDKICIGSNGVTSKNTPRTLVHRNAARRALADAHPMLIVPDGQPLAVSLAPLEGDLGFSDLIQAWKQLININPLARLWIIGEGSRSREVWDELVASGLSQSVIMPGQFDDLDDVLQAADLVVHPLKTKLRCSQLLRAIAAGTCSIVPQETADHLGLTHNVETLVYANRNPREFAQTLIDALLSPSLQDDTIREKFRSACESVAARFQIKDRLHHYLVPLAQPSSRK